MKISRLLGITTAAVLLPLASLSLAEMQPDYDFGDVYQRSGAENTSLAFQAYNSAAIYHAALWATDFEATDYQPGWGNGSLERADMASMEVIGVSRYGGPVGIPVIDRIMEPFSADD